MAMWRTELVHHSLRSSRKISLLWEIILAGSTFCISSGGLAGGRAGSSIQAGKGREGGGEEGILCIGTGRTSTPFEEPWRDCSDYYCQVLH